MAFIDTVQETDTESIELENVICKFILKRTVSGFFISRSMCKHMLSRGVADWV